MDEQKENKKMDCCGNISEKKEGKGIWQGLLYGLLPHTGCIAFIAFTVLGVSTATAFFRPLLMSRYFFHGLILLSFIFATISAVLYLRKRDMLSIEGIKQKRGYLSVLYGTSIGINLLLFMVIFPLAANMTGAVVAIDGIPQLTLNVDIPCPGHAPLISESLKAIKGVKSVKYSFPEKFEISYDSSETSEAEILAIDVFTPYPAKVLSRTQSQVKEIQPKTSSIYPATGCGHCGGCSGSCDATCGG